MSSRWSLPDSSRIMIEVAVATGLVREAMSKRVSRVIASRWGRGRGASSADVGDLAVTADQDDGAWDFAFGDGAIDRRRRPWRGGWGRTRASRAGPR